MSPSSTKDYDLLKEAVLKKYDINAEAYRQRFRAREMPAEESLQELFICLKDLFIKWVKYDSSSKEDIMETVMLEQYLRVLQPAVKMWVKEHNPMMAEQAANLVEDFVAAHKGPGAYRYAGGLPMARALVHLATPCSSSIKNGASGWGRLVVED
ncbi:zinc finger and SCAN domain-containing protein 32-like [Anguilla rostrata]|uniref:zinc finger and SCAN domain-containing protein 32-like n=1 Tax=Anguilla rostrata TaxID=7938 RepID=UPI0030CEFE49